MLGMYSSKHELCIDSISAMQRDDAPNPKTHPNMFRQRSLFTASCEKTPSSDLSLKLCCTSGTFQKWIKQSRLSWWSSHGTGWGVTAFCDIAKGLIAWTECFSFTMGPWTEPEDTRGIWTHNHHQFCSSSSATTSTVSVFPVSSASYYVIFRHSSATALVGCMQAAMNLSLLRLIFVIYAAIWSRAKGGSNLVSLPWTHWPTVHAVTLAVFATSRTLFWVIVNCCFSPLKTAGHVLPV